MREITAGEIRTLVGGQLHGNEDQVINRVAALDRAAPEALSFIANAKYLQYLQATRAGVVLVTETWRNAVPGSSTAIVVDDPHLALHAVLNHLHPATRPEPEIHATAVISPSARIADGVNIGPLAVVGADTEVGAGAVIGAHAVIGSNCRIGRDVTLHPHVSVYDGVTICDRVIIHSGARIGKDGFGYVWKDGGHRKVPQIGGCVIGEDVEVGTNVTIDRGSVGDTVIGAGTKIDNLVHIGHNAQIGKHVLLVSQVGISGSVTIGDYAVLGGQSGVGGHLSIGARARVGGQGGVISDVPAGETYSGYPARPHRESLRAHAAVFRLPELLRRLKKLENAVFRSPDDRSSAE